MQIKFSILDVYQNRREAVFNQMKENSILILPANPSSKRSNDTDNRYK
ncbi:MAG: aminopeptidase P N-terminal domain-containing protein, partial [Candidatus Thorarchaeota archaeon]